MIDIENVSFTYGGEESYVFQNLNLHIARGAFVAIEGESGCGKTTLINLLLRDLLPTSGNIRVMGDNIRELSPKELVNYRHRLGVVFQDTKLLPDKTVYENLEFSARVLEINKKSTVNRITYVLGMLGMTDLYKRKPDELSGGQQQKVCMARALMGSPNILLCDEPTGNLDPDSSMEFMKLLNLIHLQGITIVMATHATRLVEQFKDCTVVNLDNING